MLTWQSWSITYIQTSNQINQQETHFISSFPFLSCLDQVTYGHMFNHVWTLRSLLRLLRWLTTKHGPASSNSDKLEISSTLLVYIKLFWTIKGCKSMQIHSQLPSQAKVLSASCHASDLLTQWLGYLGDQATLHFSWKPRLVSAISSGFVWNRSKQQAFGKTSRVSMILSHELFEVITSAPGKWFGRIP